MNFKTTNEYFNKLRELLNSDKYSRDFDAEKETV
jgi:hypothetical protein